MCSSSIIRGKGLINPWGSGGADYRSKEATLAAPLFEEKGIARKEY